MPQPRLIAAQKLFYDEIFQDHLDKLHVGHQQRFDDLKADTHGSNGKLIFCSGQTLFIGVVVLFALFFSERYWSKAICARGCIAFGSVNQSTQSPVSGNGE